MRRSVRRFTKSLVRGATALACGALEAPAVMCYFAADLLEEAVDAFDKFGTEIEIKLETIDRSEDD